jgi:hypothetical protein
MEEDSQAVSRKHSLEEYSGETGPEDELLSDRERKSVKNISLNSSIFARGHWCYDTPGTVNQDQVLGDFTLEELIHVIPRSTLIPRIFILRPRETLLVAAIGRIDVLETIGDGHSKTHPNSVYVSYYAQM